MIPDDLIGLPEAARLLGISRQSVLRWIKEGRITGFRIGHRWKVRKSDLLDLVQQFGQKQANDRKIAIKSSLPLSKKELAEQERIIDQRLREIGVRK